MRLRNMLEICLVFLESEPQYAYKCYAYKKKTCNEKIVGAVLKRNPENIIFGTNLSPDKELFSKILPSLFYSHGIIQSCKISEKSFKLFLRKTRTQYDKPRVNLHL